MAQNKEIKTAPQIVIASGDKKYSIHLAEVASFFEECAAFKVTDLDDIDLVLGNIETMIIDSAPENLLISEIKAPLKLLRQLKDFFENSFTEVA